MRIAVLGAGGVGGYYGGLLARAGHEVAMLARGAHLEALRVRGLEVRTPEGTFTVAVAASDDPRELEAGAIVLPLLNGVDAADRLVAAGVPDHLVLGGLTEISAVRIVPGVVERRS